MGEDEAEILKAMENVGRYRLVRSDFGVGESTARFMDFLHDKDIWSMKLQKVFVDID